MANKTINIKKELHKRLKLIALRREITVKLLIEEMLEEGLKKG